MNTTFNNKNNMDLIQQGINKGLIRFDDEQKNIYYIHQENKRRNYNNPEEKIQAETYCKLILEYGYLPEHIKLFVSVTMGSSIKKAEKAKPLKPFFR